MTVEQILAGVVVVIFLLICAAGKSRTEEPLDPADLEIRTNPDGSVTVVNYKTGETINTFPNRTEAEAFIADLRA